MAKSKGVIINTYGNIADVLIARESMCAENCASCGLCNNSNFKISASNEIGALKGEYVEVEVNTESSFLAVLLTYFVSLFLLIAGIVITVVKTNKEWLALIVGIVLLIVWTQIIKFLSKGKFLKEKMEAKIIRKIG